MLIPTRNRPEKLIRLLESISKSSILPESVIVVSSGTDMTAELKSLSFNLRIDHLFFEGFGQIRQKELGIKRIPKESRWVLFLDDDLEIADDTIFELFKLLKSSNRSVKPIIGIGLSDEKHSLSKKFRFLTLLKSYRGKVLRNGTNISYMKSPYPIETEWLNGASLWRTEVLNNYNFEHAETRYAICEDLIFSYKARTYGKLMFCPSATYRVQDLSYSKKSPETLKSLAFWKYYFVSNNVQLSKVLFFLSFTLTTVKYCVTSKSFKSNWQAVATLSLLLKSIISQEDALSCLKRFKI